MPLVLLSGGMDSCVALYYARFHHPGETLWAMAFRYGQRHVSELNNAWRISEIIGARYLEIPIPTYFFPNRGSSLLAGTKLDVVRKYDAIPSHEEALTDPAFIPHRNLLFIAIAAGYANKYQCKKIYTGLRGGFPDCDKRFLEHISTTLCISNPEFPIKVISPCHGSREETLGLAYSLPGCWDALAYTKTCFEGTEPPCGKCLPCLKRAEGFAKFGKPDPQLERIEREGKRPDFPENLL